MPTPVKLAAIPVALLLASAGYWYYCVDTLKLSEIVGDVSDPGLSIVVNVIDGDTGLTRRDVQHLRSKAPYWNARMEEVAAIGDPAARQQAELVLMAELTDDSALKKIVQKVWGAELDVLKSILSEL